MVATTEMASLVAHVAAFVRIVNASQTQELHQWTHESLERAFAWADTMESLAAKAANDGEEVERALIDALAQHLQHAALPTMSREEVLSTAQLCNATRFVCDAVLTSAWLSTHPTRAELVALVLAKRFHSVSTASKSGGSSAGDSLGELIMSGIHTQRSLRSTTQLAHVASRALGNTRVQLRSAAVEIPSMESYTLQRRTLRLQSLARTLQANLCAARALSSSMDTDATYTDLLGRVDDQLKPAQRDVTEVVVWTVVLDWPSSPPDASAVRSDVLQILARWADSQSIHTLLSLAPWPAAALAGVCSVFAQHYVAGIFHSTALHTLEREEWRCRVGALALQSAELQTLVDSHVAAMEPCTREQLFSASDVAL